MSAFADQGPIAAMMADGRFDGGPLITKKIPLTDIVEQGFHALTLRKQDNVKILVTME